MCKTARTKKATGNKNEFANELQKKEAENVENEARKHVNMCKTARIGKSNCNKNEFANGLQKKKVGDAEKDVKLCKTMGVDNLNANNAAGKNNANGNNIFPTGPVSHHLDAFTMTEAQVCAVKLDKFLMRLERSDDLTEETITMNTELNLNEDTSQERINKIKEKV